MPRIGKDMVDAAVVRWLKQPGDAVRRDEPLLEVSTRRVDCEIPAPSSGRLIEIVAPAGLRRKAGDLLARIE